MKKFPILLLVLALLLPGLALGETYTYLGDVGYGRYVPVENLGISSAPGMADADETRLILVTCPPLDSYWIQIPEGERVEDYHGRGIRFTLEEKLATARTQEELRYYVPTSIQIVGEVFYGRVTSYGDTYVELESADSGDTLRLTLKSDTQIINPLREDASFEVVYSGDTALMLYIING